MHPGKHLNIPVRISTLLYDPNQFFRSAKFEAALVTPSTYTITNLRMRSCPDLNCVVPDVQLHHMRLVQLYAYKKCLHHTKSSAMIERQNAVTRMTAERKLNYHKQL